MSRVAKSNKPESPREVPKSAKQSDPSNSLRPIWSFDNIDTDGAFAFDLSREDLNAKFVLDKLIRYSSMTWQEILQQTHDHSKSKNHELKNLDHLSKKAQERIYKKHFDLEDDSIFSLALDNKKRLIGLREGATFHVVWYDANHEFAPSSKKHT